jgi:hypothetical protein
MLVSCLYYSSTLKMEAAGFSETSADFYRTTRRYIPKARNLHRCDNLKSYRVNYCLFLALFSEKRNDN